MTKNDVEKAECLALEFARRATQLLLKLGPEDMDADLCGSKDTGALRRASMELTRALADMRRP